ncbi:hypothetical protein [Microbispora sp. NPDC046933]|uniref:hypothetical protein n=1 Tax=Microbispora sp. NPDC046933 TaxID=3155618 RepID=UPI003404FD0E
MKITRLAALCLLAATSCAAGHGGTPATPIPATSRAEEGQTTAQPDAEVLFGRLRTAESAPPASPSPEPAARASGRPSPAPSVEQVFEARAMKKGRSLSAPNPGSGPGDLRLREALLTGYEGVYESMITPGVVVALPAAEGRATEFISLRQAVGVFESLSGCERWTVGSWRVALRDFNRHGVQIAATLLSAMADGAWKRSAEFSETVVTGPAQMVSSLGDPGATASCRKFSSVLGLSMSVKPFPVPPLGSRSWAFRVFEEESVTQWVEVVQTPRYVLEIRIPTQSPKPRTDPAVLLPRIAEAAYARAEAALT